MGNGYQNPIIPPDEAYPRWRRVRDAYRFIIAMAKSGMLEITQSIHVANTYRLEQSLIKRMKAKKRCELSFMGEGK